MKTPKRRRQAGRVRKPCARWIGNCHIREINNWAHLYPQQLSFVALDPEEAKRIQLWLGRYIAWSAQQKERRK